jgi:hypothetical protein
VKRKPISIISAPAFRRRRRRSWIRWVVGAPVAIVVGYAAFFALASLRVSYPLAGRAEEPEAVLGAYHVHSTRSDGRKSPEEIAQEARAAGLRFVVFADHNTTDIPRPRFHEGVLLIFGSELSTPAGHLVAVGTSRALTREEREGDVFGTIARLGGRAFIAHPEQWKRPWTDWQGARAAAGVELYSADSMFRTAQEEPLTVLGPAGGAYLANPSHGLLTLVRAQPEVTRRVLELNAQRQVAALCAHDAHGIPGYEEEFRALALYLPPSRAGTGGLPEDPEAAARKVVDDLASGSAWCSFRAIAPAGGFSIEGLSEPGRREAFAGDTLRIKLPPSAPREISVRVSGPAAVLEDGRSVRLDGTGPVQIEVWALVPGMFFQDGWKPWIVPSPIRVMPKVPKASSASGSGEVAGEGLPPAAASVDAVP